MTADLTQSIFTNDTDARAYLESVRWPRGPVCPHCGGVEKITALRGKSHRAGLYQCNDCTEHFTVTVGTVYERSHIPLHKWLLATHLMSASKKGISAHQLHRMLGITYKSAWFMAHRIREAMRGGELDTPFGSGGGAVEVDETYIGSDPEKVRGPRGGHHKNKVLALVDRDSKQARTMVIDKVDWATVRPILQENLSHEARVMTDEGSHYGNVSVYFADHQTVNHSAKEYVRLSDRSVHSNTVEGYFSIFKRGMKGVYQHCGKQHLHRYLAEFDFRYNNRIKLGINDATRMTTALKGISGKRLTYRRIGDGASPRALA